ncbi:MAG: DUF2156 domain-containing protein [Deltaproteobacteria bacterium]|nr:DUF2156 domain-containing protein [Deltaproteobacteria bacterium]
MTFNKEHLGINHSESIGQMLKAIPTALSEYCFPNLFLFRDKHKYNIISNMGDQYISGLSYDGQRYIMPLANLENCTDDYLENLKSLLEEYDCIFPIPEKWLHLFPEGNFRKEFIIDDSEYIYTREKLSEYPGRKLSKKRNLVKQFLRDNNPEIKAINDVSKPAIIELLELWQARTYQEMG